jgi:hypothetical protein
MEILCLFPTYTFSRGRFTMRLMKLKHQGQSLAWAFSKVLGWIINKYSLLKEGPKNCINFRPHKTWIYP